MSIRPALPSSPEAGGRGRRPMRGGLLIAIMAAVAAVIVVGVQAVILPGLAIAATTTSGPPITTCLIPPTTTLTATPSPTGTDTQAPSKPGNPVLTTCGSNLIISWAASTDNVRVAYYQLNRQVTSSNTPLTYNLSSTSFAVPYTGGYERYWVVAFDAAGNSAISGTTSIGTPPTCLGPCTASPTHSPTPSSTDTVPPTAPGTPVVTVSGSLATVKWTASTDNVGVVAYTVWVQSFDVIQGWETAAPNTMLNVSITPGLGYTFWVIARDAAGNNSPSSGRTSIGSQTCNFPCTGPPPPSTSTPPPVGACTVTYTILSQWPGGFQADVRINNTGTAAINGWQLKWSFPSGQTITQLWNGTYTQTGAAVTVTNLSWNSIIPAAGSADLGFNANWSGSNAKPSSFVLNGATCLNG